MGLHLEPGSAPLEKKGDGSFPKGAGTPPTPAPGTSGRGARMPPSATAPKSLSSGAGGPMLGWRLPLPWAADHPAVQLLDPTALTDRQMLLARQPRWVQRPALPAGPSRPHCLNPGWPETPAALVPTPGRIPRGSCRPGAPVRAPGDPREGGGVQGDSDGKWRPPSGEAGTRAGGGCPGSGLHRGHGAFIHQRRRPWGGGAGLSGQAAG